jgi:hypothetical protein
MVPALSRGGSPAEIFDDGVHSRARTEPVQAPGDLNPESGDVAVLDAQERDPVHVMFPELPERARSTSQSRPAPAATATSANGTFIAFSPKVAAPIVACRTEGEPDFDGRAPPGLGVLQAELEVLRPPVTIPPLGLAIPEQPT